MTQEEIIKMARQAHGPITAQWWDMDVAALERFAALVAAAERAKLQAVAESYEPRCDSCPSGVANAIRARGRA